MRCLCENSEAKWDCSGKGLKQSRTRRLTRHNVRSRWAPKWIRWGRRCIFKCSRRKPPQRRSSPPKFRIQFTARLCTAFLRICLLPNASLSFSRYLNGFRTKTLLFFDKGFYKLASHDDFYWRRRLWLMGYEGCWATSSSSGTFVGLPAARATLVLPSLSFLPSC